MQCDGNRFIITNGMPSVKWLHPNAIYTTYELLPPLKMGDYHTKTCCHAGNRMTAVNNLFYRFNFKLFEITLTAHGHLSLGHFK